MKRNANAQEKVLLFLAAEGKCQRCGKSLADDFHADHVIPYRVSGRTNLFEMQALCPDCNLKKGSSMSLAEKRERAHKLCDQIEHFSGALRHPQKETLKLLRGISDGLAGGSWPYLTSPGHLVEEIVPGGGKSYIAVMASSVLIGSGFFDAGLWISPRLTLLQQAKEDFASVALAMQQFGTRVPIFNPAGIAPREVPDQAQRLLDTSVKMWVLPYQRLKGVSFVLNQMANSRNVLLIFDEFQLLRDYQTDQEDPTIHGYDGWFRLLDPLVRSCIERTGFGGIILSGGLFRNDKRMLPLVHYRPGDINQGEDPKSRYPIADVRYTLSEAQADRAIIKIDLDFYDGEVEFQIDEEQDLQNLNSLSDDFYNAKLIHFLEEPEVWKSVIDDMLTSLDYYNPPGAGHRTRYLVLSRDIAQAELHAKYLREKVRNPLLIHSKLSVSEQRQLEKFRRGEGDWDGLACVAMGYIGLSIQDLSHMAYLSHYRSAAWINQAFHRITRKDQHRAAPPYEHQLARIFLPNDPVMRKLAEDFLRDQNPAVAILPLPPKPI